MLPVVALLLGVLLTAGLSGCGGSDGAATDPSAAQTALNGDVFNEDDVEFAATMIPHHAQAIELVTLTQGRDLRPEVLALADQILTARVTEVESMTTWLTAWDQPIPETSIDHANAHAEDGEAGPEVSAGMVDPNDVAALAEIGDDTEFEARWLSLMAEHHDGAIDVATAEKERGRFPEALALATTVIDDQSTEIDQLALLAN